MCDLRQVCEIVITLLKNLGEFFMYVEPETKLNIVFKS
jgi:hypothetical protein